MIIDVVTYKGAQWMRYESNVAPKIGETITTLEPTKAAFTVVAVDHLVKPKILSDDMRLDLITVTVKEI